MKTIKIIFWAVLALMLAAVILFETNEQLTGFLGVTEADEFKLLSNASPVRLKRARNEPFRFGHRSGWR